jgi:gliding motility-associated-like protein
MRISFTILQILITAKIIIAQNETNIWYFTKGCGLDFNSGTPEVLYDGQAIHGWASSTICDTTGMFLFCTDAEYIYSVYGIMQNSDGLVNPRIAGLATVKWPGQEFLYFLFTAADPNGPDAGFYYSLVDLSQGLGGVVVEKNIPIPTGWDVSDRIALVKKDKTENVWVIVRKNEDDAIAAYLVDEFGFHADPVISTMPNLEMTWQSIWGYLKISPNKNFLISTYGGYGFEVCSFDAAIGKAIHLFLIASPSIISPTCSGVEFSPDSKYLYVNYTGQTSSELYQYDMQYVTDLETFKASAIKIDSHNTFELQLARDGKIYCSPNQVLDPTNWYFISAIEKPWIRGEGCSFTQNVLNVFPNHVLWGFSNILVDYLLRFEWAGEQCQGYPIHFKPNFIPEPQTIQWDFDDGPGSNSWQLSPTYTFKNPGVHEVKVDVWYPSGRYEHTSREIEISPSPLPLLGNDTLICDGASITLNANCVADFFSWSTGQFGVSSIIVSDSGTYWVKGRFNDSGCEGYDTIHVGFHPPTIIDESNLQITPTTCNGSSGSITGLTALGPTPYAYRWVDLSEVEYGTDIDVSGLPAGQYYLTITNANGCETVSGVYTIEDAGDLQLTQVQTTRPHCFNDDGQIVVHAFSPSGSILEYSIDAGVNYQSDSIFSNLFASSYAVQVRDENGCSGFYLDNPVDLEDIPGPQVTQVNVTDETDFLGNGVIEIVASGSTPVMYYSIDGGVTWQENDGGFYHLQSRIYNLQVWDENGCDTNFTVEIQNVILTYLHAVTEEGGHCLGNTAMVPVYVDNFNSVADFHLKLGYNTDNLECEGFMNIHPQLADSLTGWVDQAAGEIHLTWNGELPLTFSQQEQAADLVFTTKNPGQGELAWYTGETESYFTNSSGNPIPAEFSTGQVTVYEPPEIILAQSKTVCTGQFASMMSIAVGNQPPLTFRWIYPAGDTASNDPFFFSVTQANAGLYTLLATDHVGCTDQKSIELIVSENPVAAFHGSDTLEMHTGDVLNAGAGLASYLWNTGDTTESIVILSVGMYWVGMESLIGCVGTDSVYVKLIEDEIPPEPNNKIFIPNAFSPDGDGINDNFNISYNNNPFPISHCVLHIFNRWGEEIFQSDDITQGWDGKKNGKDCPGGVYVYKIVFSADGIAGSQERVGTVTLVR